MGPMHCLQDPQTSFFSNFFIKNESHGTIHIFKNYFATVFSVFNKISCIQTDPILHNCTWIPVLMKHGFKVKDALHVSILFLEISSTKSPRHILWCLVITPFVILEYVLRMHAIIVLSMQMVITYCMFIKPTSSEEDANILGAIQQQDYRFLFDVGAGVMEFVPEKCQSN